MNLRRDPRTLTLSTMDVLVGASRKELQAICQLTSEVRFAPGDVLCRQGAAALEVFLIAEGEVAISRDDAVIGLAASGSMIGEMGLLGRVPRSATATALTDVRALVLSRTEFNSLLGCFPRIAANVRAVSDQRAQELIALLAA